MAHHVFISYASKNKQLADALCHTLEQHRISCWIAPRDVLPGEPYAREIIRGIRDCQIIVLIYTNDSNASEHVLNEIDKADRKSTRLNSSHITRSRMPSSA